MFRITTPHLLLIPPLLEVSQISAWCLGTFHVHKGGWLGGALYQSLCEYHDFSFYCNLNPLGKGPVFPPRPSQLNYQQCLRLHMNSRCYIERHDRNWTSQRMVAAITSKAVTLHQSTQQNQAKLGRSIGFSALGLKTSLGKPRSMGSEGCGSSNALAHITRDAVEKQYAMERSS